MFRALDRWPGDLSPGTVQASTQELREEIPLLGREGGEVDVMLASWTSWDGATAVNKGQRKGAFCQWLNEVVECHVITKQHCGAGALVCVALAQTKDAPLAMTWAQRELTMHDQQAAICQLRNTAYSGHMDTNHWALVAMPNNAFKNLAPPPRESEEGHAAEEILDGNMPRGTSRIVLGDLNIRRGETPKDPLAPAVEYWVRECSTQE